MWVTLPHVRTDPGVIVQEGWPSVGVWWGQLGESQDWGSWRSGGKPEDLSASLHISGAPAIPAGSPEGRGGGASGRQRP